MEIDKVTLDQICEWVQAKYSEDIKAKAETEYLLQKSKYEASKDEER